MIKYEHELETNVIPVLFKKDNKRFCHRISIQNELNSGLIARRSVFLIDKSLFMNGLKWIKIKLCLIKMIKKLRINIDRYCLYLFDDSSSKSYPEQGIISANAACLEDIILYLHHAVPTENERDINVALQKSIKIIKKDIELCKNSKNTMSDVYINEIIFISNGIPNDGQKDTDEIIKNVLHLLRNRPCIIHSFSICGDKNDSSWTYEINQPFMQVLATNNNGFYARIKQSTIEQQLDHYFEILSNPLLMNIKIEYKNQNIIGLTNTKFPIIHKNANDIIICGQFTTTESDLDDAKTELEIETETEMEMEINAVISGVTGKYVIDNECKIIKLTKFRKDINIEFDPYRNDLVVDDIKRCLDFHQNMIQNMTTNE